MEIKVKKMHESAMLPEYAHPGDVGMDVFALEAFTLAPGKRHVCYLGFALEFETGYAAIMKDKSSLPNKYGVHVIGGVYDAGYRGEYNVQLINLGHDIVKFEKNQKLAQIVILPIALPTLVEVDKLSESMRGEGRFGSTGKF